MGKTEIRFEVLSVQGLLAKQFPPSDSMLTGELLDRAGALLITGPQKIGKSLLACQLALSLADRRPLLGFSTGNQQYHALILQAEVCQRRMKERFEKQQMRFSADAQSAVNIACVLSSIKLNRPEDEGVVRSLMADYKPDLAVVDPLVNFHTGDENEASDMSRVTTVLDGLRDLGAAVAVLHHHSKGSTSRVNVGHMARGSSVLAGWYDSHLSLEWADYAGKMVRLRFELRNGETPGDKVLKLNSETLLFEEREDEAARIAEVVSVVREIGPAHAETVGHHCSRTRQWASDWLNRAVDDRKLERTESRPILYSVPGQPTETRVDVTRQGVVVSTNTPTQPSVWVGGEEVPFPVTR